jgi:hypothetical protein
LEQLYWVIEEIRKLMVRSVVEAVSKGKLNRGEHAIAAEEKKQQGKGADGQLQEKVWDPGRSQQ